MLDLTLFRSRVFSASTAAALFNYICVYALVFVLPFLLIQGRGMNTQQAGLLLTAQPIVMAIVAPIAGAMSDRIGSRPLAVAGMFVLALGLLVLGRVSPHGAIWQIALWLAVVGFGVGLFTSPNNSALMGAAPRHRQGIAAGVLASARNVGMVLGVGIAGAIFMQYGVVEALYTASALAVVGAVISMFTGDEARSSASAPSPRA
jgi:MFS family permease